MDEKVAVLEGLLFLVGEEGLTTADMIKRLEINATELPMIISVLNDKYALPNSGLALKQVGGRYKLTTKAEHLSYYQNFAQIEINNDLSVAALETLAIIAYNQPITRLGVSNLRGADSSHLIRKLINMGLVTEAGRSDALGKPFLFKTTNHFLDYFNINSLDELPVLKQQETLDSQTDLYYTKYQED